MTKPTPSSSAYVVECIIKVDAAADASDQRPGWIRRMIGPFPSFDAAHEWMLPKQRYVQTMLIHPLTEPLQIQMQVAKDDGSEWPDWPE